MGNKIEYGYRKKGNILVVEPNIRYKGAANKAFDTPTFANNYQEAMEKISANKYDAVISALDLYGESDKESINIGKQCLIKKIAFAILANGDEKEINKLRVELCEDEELVKLVGSEDPVKHLVMPLVGYDKTNPNLWEITLRYAELERGNK